MIFAWICIVIYSIALVLILCYAIAQLNLLVNYLKAQKKKDPSPVFDMTKPDEVPYVTIQLPVFNEAYVMERLLDNIAKIDYPNDRLEIQVLDDSTDETVQTTKAHVERLAQAGLDIVHITRTKREGYKAGALKEALDVAKGDFIAIFDADFLPDADWLYKTVPYFKEEEIGWCRPAGSTSIGITLY
jgi:Glycosyltransferases, probably involved in cell wall biogenesis